MKYLLVPVVIPAGRPRPFLKELYIHPKQMHVNDDVLCRLYEFCSHPSILSHSNRRLHHLWQIPTVRSNWLLRHLSPRDALQRAAVEYRDFEVTQNLHSRISVSDISKAHLLIDLFRLPSDRDLVQMILFFLENTDLSIQMSLYLKALMFVEHPLKEEILVLIQATTHDLTIFEICLDFAIVLGYHSIFEYLMGHSRLTEQPQLLYRALCTACRLGRADMVQQMLQSHPEPLCHQLSLPKQLAKGHGFLSLFEFLCNKLFDRV